MFLSPFHRPAARVAGAAALGIALIAGLAGCGGSSTTAVTNPAPLETFQVVSSATTGLLPQGTAGSPYSYGFQTNAGQPGVTAIAPIAFHATAPLPVGLTLTSQGILEGTPNQIGHFSVQIEAVDSSSVPQTADFTYLMNVALPGAVLTQVSHTTLGGQGQNADVIVATSSASHASYAYIGTRGTLGDCPATGVKIVALAQISNPQLVATVGGVVGASQEEPRVITGISSPDFHPSGSGDLMAVTEQPCNPSDITASQTGVQFFDVTDPTHPIALGNWNSGLNGADDVAFIPVSGPLNQFGQVDHTQDHIYALVAVPGSETAPNSTEGDLRVLDVTNPVHPVEVRNFGVLRATDTALAQAVQGVDQRVFLSSIELSDDRQTAYLSFWDEGVVILDVSNPLNIASNNPAILLDHITYPITQVATSLTPSEPEGNTHMALPVLGDTDLLVADDVCASGTTTTSSGQTQYTNPAVGLICGQGSDVPLTNTTGWGFLRTYQLPTPSSATVQSFYVTPQSMSDPAPDRGIYTAHNLAWNGNLVHPHAYVSWYSSGVVDLDITSIDPPTVLASFTPPDTPDPNGTNPAVDNPAKAMVYGVAAYASNGNNYILASDVNSGLWIVQETNAPELTILTTTLPDGNVDQPYLATLAAANGQLGASRLSFSVANGSNPLPSGLTMDANGNITGAPAVAGTTTVTFQVIDGAGNTSYQSIQMTIDQNLAVFVGLPNATTVTTPVAGVPGEPYSMTLTAVNGTSPYTFSTVRSTLPSGLALSTAGVITGTPVSTGTTSVTVQVTDSSVPVETATLTVPVAVNPLQVQQTTLTDADVGAVYSGVVNMVNGTPPFIPTLVDGALPPGITLGENESSTLTWLLSGTPTQAGVYNFTVRITDDYNQFINQPYTLVVDPYEVTPDFLPPAVEGQGYLESPTMQGGTGPYIATLVLGTLPPGITMDQNGNFSGVPASGSAGNYPFTMQVKDANGLVTNKNYTFVVFTGRELEITTLQLEESQVGQPINQTVTADFGTPAYTFSLASGTLPAGITLDPGGALTGVPAQADVGNYSFTVAVTDSLGNTATRHFNWTIIPVNSTH